MEHELNIQHTKELESLGNISAGFTLGETDDWPYVQRKALPRYEQFARELNLRANNLVRVKQKHTTRVMCATAQDKGEGVTQNTWLEPADGIITNEPNLVLCILTADCTPVSLVDTKTQAIGLVHSGWRGTVSKISKNAIEMMQEHYGSDTDDIVAYMGPHICKNCFEFGAKDIDQLGEFAHTPYVIEDEGSDATGKIHVDTNACIRATLKACELKDENILECDECSFESSGRLASFRRRPLPKSRTMSFLAIHSCCS